VSVIGLVIRVAADWDVVLVENDPAELGRFMTDDWVYVGPTGPVTKAQIIEWISEGRLAHRSMKVVEQPQARRLGDTVLLTARKRSTGAWEGTCYAADEWISQVWVPSPAGWQCAFSQKTEAG
jgi:ketosteroid isomerase-like protein